jgi:hypothetical protein
MQAPILRKQENRAGWPGFKGVELGCGYMATRRDWRQGAAGLVVASFGFPNCACLASANFNEPGDDRCAEATVVPLSLSTNGLQNFRNELIKQELLRQ